MANIIRYVDTGSDAGGDGTTSATSSGDNTHAYQTLNAWEAAEQTNLDAANNTHTVHCNRTNAGGMDVTVTGINGWTTSATDFITVIDDDFPADGIYDNTKYTLHNDDSAANFLIVQEEYVRFVNVQALLTETANNTRRMFRLSGFGAPSDIRFDSCIVNGAVSGTGVGMGISIPDADATVTIFNTIISNFLIAADAGFQGIDVTNATAVNVYNCTINNCTVGINRVAGTVNVINTLIFECENDLNGVFNTIDYCATSEGAGEGTNGVDISGDAADDFAVVVTDADGGDYSVTDTNSPIYQTGNGATPKAVFTDDIIGTTRDAVDLNWDIGAFGFVVSGVVNAAGQADITISSLAGFRRLNRPGAAAAAIVTSSLAGMTKTWNAAGQAGIVTSSLAGFRRLNRPGAGQAGIVTSSLAGMRRLNRPGAAQAAINIQTLAGATGGTAAITLEEIFRYRRFRDAGVFRRRNLKGVY